MKSTPALRGDVEKRLRVAGCVFAEEEAELLLAAATSSAMLESMVGRRVAGVPLEYIVGWAAFCGLRLVIRPGVFVPRHRTEWLVRQAVSLLGPGSGTQVHLADLCCGAGAIAAAVIARLPASNDQGRGDLHAVDIDPVAVDCARLNLRRPPRGLGPGRSWSVRVHHGDLFDPLPDDLRGRLNLVTANVPYVPTGAIETLPTEARLHEARAALDGGLDGLDVLRRVSSAAPDWLVPGGSLLAEVGELQAETAAAILVEAGLDPRLEYSADFDTTVLIGTLPARPIQANPG